MKGPLAIGGKKTIVPLIYCLTVSSRRLRDGSFQTLNPMAGERAPQELSPFIVIHIAGSKNHMIHIRGG
jgi:hypothetical protein